MAEALGKIRISFSNNTQKVTDCQEFAISDSDSQKVRFQLNHSESVEGYLYRSEKLIDSPNQQNLFKNLTKFLNESTVFTIEHMSKGLSFTFTEKPVTKSDSRNKLKYFLCL
ncbi:hypothetical protein JQC92_17635 [Shewanella sp. 202IG2-18]|uniref:hypothetical protein n=1 Tax=Parashewanella hymeniacidonis TaxID=2807618 RepID=UPI00195F2957|nr:hypothetical protein [Parashewanella hymeniacidonis]MBM7073833.1 hypothetical protein [Parashewanella hymeniacidonis]